MSEEMEKRIIRPPPLGQEEEWSRTIQALMPSHLPVYRARPCSIGRGPLNGTGSNGSPAVFRVVWDNGNVAGARERRKTTVKAAGGTDAAVASAPQLMLNSEP